MVSEKPKTLEDKLQKDMENFFSEFSRDYFFVLSTKDYDPAATNELYCLCFNDTDNHGQKSENLLIQLLRRRDDPSFMLEPTICSCGYASRPFKRIKNLVEHYLQDHTLKLYEFLNHIAFGLDFHDQRMVNIASDLLLAWRDKDGERSIKLRESDKAASSIPQPTNITEPMNSGAIDMSLTNTMRGSSDSGSLGGYIPEALPISWV